MKLYFVRHGKTEWNLEGRLQGAKGDSPLLEESIEQVRELGRYLSDTHFDLVFSSDLHVLKKQRNSLLSLKKVRLRLPTQRHCVNGTWVNSKAKRFHWSNRFIHKKCTLFAII